MKTTAGPNANQAWHMLALHQFEAELRDLCHHLILDAALHDHPRKPYEDALDAVNAEAAA